MGIEAERPIQRIVLVVLLAGCTGAPGADTPETGDSAVRESAPGDSTDSTRDSRAGDSTADDSAPPADADGDGVRADLDCDDAAANVYPGATERCDGVDEDCDGAVDDHAVDALSYAPDVDGDGYGDRDGVVIACVQPPDFVADARDCDDADASVVPGTSDAFPSGHSRVAVAEGATELAVGDLDGDGHPDAAVLAPDDLAVDVLLGNGALGFAAFATVPLPAEPTALGLGDIDGDGVADLVVAVEGAVLVRVGLGDGTFLGGGTTETGCDVVSSLTTVDVDGDGLDDVAVGCSDPAFVTMVNDGTGRFVATREALGSPASQVVVADLDADGDMDAALAGDGGSDVYVFTNDGAGTFTARTEALLADTDVLAAGDLDGDGDVDLVTGTTDDADLVFLANDGAGGFTATRVAGPARTTGTTHVCVFDQDGDGDEDLYADLVRFEGTPTGPSDAGQEPGVSIDVDDLAGADLDGDGVGDLLVLGDGDLDVSRGRGDGTFVGPLHLEGGALSVVTHGDMDGDGEEDIAAVVDGDTIAWYLNDGHAIYTPNGTYTADGDVTDLRAADLDGDGDADLAETDASGLTLLFVEAGEVVSTETLALRSDRAELAPADVDGDGDLDLVVVEPDVGGFRTLLNDGAGTFTSTGTTSLGVGAFALRLVVDDLTGDGLLDVVTTDFTYGPGPAVFAGDGAGTFTEVGSFAMSDRVAHLAAGDVDEDGDVDLLVGGWEDMRWALGRNEGAGTAFTSVEGVLAGPATYATIADLNADGHLDVLAGGAVFWGDGATFVGAAWLPWVVDGSDHVVLDADGDGWPDIGVAGDGGAQLRLWCPE